MPYRVVVIGAGFAGIGMAIALQQAGIEDFVVLDLADGTRPWPGRTSTWLPTVRGHRVTTRQPVRAPVTAAF